MSNPAWSPWQQDPANPTFPPLGQVTEEQPILYCGSDDVHELHCIIRSSRAIISKPGGCTLIDSLASATPVVFLDAYGYAEERNAEIWQHLGFGISYAAWRDDGYSADTLAKLHESINTRCSDRAAYPLEVGARSRAPERGCGR
jgi:UDP-N-acetylglucosamine:LPS N-acetylglucosamine transferase